MSDIQSNPFRLPLTRAEAEGEARWRQATDDRDTTRFRVTVKFYPSPFADAPGGEVIWVGTRHQITEWAEEYAVEDGNPLLHMEIDTVEVLLDD